MNILYFHLSFYTWKAWVFGSFLSGLALLRFMRAGNYSHKVSYCGAAHWCFMPVGNCSRKVSYWADTHWCFLPTGNYWWMVSYGSETQWCFLSTGNCSHKVSYWSDTQWCFMTTGNDSTGDFSTPLRCARNDRGQVLPLVLLTGRKPFAKSFLLSWHTLVLPTDRKLFA